MRLLSAIGVSAVMGGALLGTAHSVSSAEVRSKRMFNFSNRQQQLNAQQRQYNNGQQQQQQQQQQQVYSSNQQQHSTDYSNLLQQYAALTSGNSNTGYYDTYTNSVSDYSADPYLSVASSYGSGVSENPDSSPALSALALLGFLYFLNLIQDVLQNNGRRKRSTDDLSQDSREGIYSTSYLEDPLIFLSEEETQEAPDGAPDSMDLELSAARSLQEDPVEKEETPAQERMDEVSPKSPRSLSFLENFFIKLPQALGLSWKHSKIDRDGRDEKPMDVGNYITSRIKMISSIMNFLQDPRPSRIRRGIPLSEDLLQDGEDSEESSAFSVVLDRIRRFTHSMNSWYDDLGGRNYEPSETPTHGVAAKMVSYLGGGRDLQDAMSKDAVPTFFEITKSLDGRHPHCLQRALCRMNSHVHTTSFLPKMAIQFASNMLTGTSNSDGLAKANQRAMAAGREGLNCEEEFPDCLSVGPSKTPVEDNTSNKK